MEAPVNPRARRTEERIVAAAARLFPERGYAGTTLAGVADAAGVAARTVYVRFGTKAALLLRVMDVAVVGDHDATALAGRDWAVRTRTAPTLEERVAAWADGGAALMARLAPLMPVALDAAATEPAVAVAAQAAREDTRRSVRVFWEALAADGLLHPDADVEWLSLTTGLLAAADTSVLLARTHGFTAGGYRDWLHRTVLHLATTPSPASS